MSTNFNQFRESIIYYVNGEQKPLKEIDKPADVTHSESLLCWLSFERASFNLRFLIDGGTHAESFVKESFEVILWFCSVLQSSLFLWIRKWTRVTR